MLKDCGSNTMTWQDSVNFINIERAFIYATISGCNLKSQHGQKKRKKKGNLLQLSNNLDVSFIFDHLFKRWWLLMPKQNGVTKKKNGSYNHIHIY